MLDFMKMAAMADKAAPALEALPALLNKMGEFLTFASSALRGHTDALARLENKQAELYVLCQRINSAVNPGELSPEMTLQIIADAANDPRNAVSGVTSNGAGR